jgi:preprotein translocase subunit SecA
MFKGMIAAVQEQTVSNLMHVRIVQEDEVARLEEEQRRRREEELEMLRALGVDGDGQPVQREEEKISRNAPCPCGSGKKYKKCCGSLRR